VLLYFSANLVLLKWGNICHTKTFSSKDVEEWALSDLHPLLRTPVQTDGPRRLYGVQVHELQLSKVEGLQHMAVVRLQLGPATVLQLTLVEAEEVEDELQPMEVLVMVAEPLHGVLVDELLEANMVAGLPTLMVLELPQRPGKILQWLLLLLVSILRLLHTW
jgi:hypothetical protein